MKKKLRELRRKREFIKLCKGALRKSYYAYLGCKCTLKRFGNKTNVTNFDLIAHIRLSKIIDKYNLAKVKAKVKKRGGKNVI